MLESRWLAMDFRVSSLMPEGVFGEPLASNGFPRLFVDTRRRVWPTVG
jgi:hypothetical protein